MVAVTFLRRFQPSFKLLCIIAFLRRLRDSRPEHGVPSTERALEELLGSSTDYAGAVCHVKPFERGKVSLPSAQRRPVVLTHCATQFAAGCSTPLENSSSLMNTLQPPVGRAKGSDRTWMRD